MITSQSTVFISEPSRDDEDTDKFVPIENFEIVMTVVESKNPYLKNKQTSTQMGATRQIAELMFNQVISDYEEMAGGHPFEKVGDWKYKGVFNGEKIVLELVG